MNTASVPDERSSQKWRLEPWTCTICNTTGLRQHKSRHMKSAGHIARANRAALETDSDFAMARFLARVDARSLTSAEKQIYDEMRAANDA